MSAAKSGTADLELSTEVVRAVERITGEVSTLRTKEAVVPGERSGGGVAAGQSTMTDGRVGGFGGKPGEGGLTGFFKKVRRSAPHPFLSARTDPCFVRYRSFEARLPCPPSSMTKARSSRAPKASSARRLSLSTPP